MSIIGANMDLTKPSQRFLHTFAIRPDVSFDQQQPQEEVILLLRAHPVTQIPWIFNTFILFILLIVTTSFLNIVFNPLQIMFSFVFGLAFIISYAWLNFLHWFFNVGVITDRRILDIDFSGITYKEVTETLLEKVEEITEKSSGYLGSIFNYGTLYVQTAGASINIEFDNIPDPSTAVRIINSLVP